MIVSIARELGAGGRTIGEAAASALGAALLDERSVIAELSERHGLPADYVATRIERAPNAGEQLIANLAAASAMLPVAPTWQTPDELVLARRYAIDREEARRRIDRTDEARLRFQRHYFDCDLYDCRQYDLVLNTESLGLERATEIATSVATALAARNPQPVAGAR